MNPGRELDALIAEKVFGFKVSEIQNGVGRKDKMYADGPAFIVVPPYSMNIAAAWQVVEKFSDIIIERDKSNASDQWLVFLCGHETFAQTAPHAICLAALKAISEFQHQGGVCPPQPG